MSSSTRRISAVCRFVPLAAGLLLFAWASGGRAQSAPPENVFHSDLMARANPDAIMVSAGGRHRWDIALAPEYGMPASYKQAGLDAGVNPGYAQFSIHAEWQPAIFAQLRLQYDYFSYFGANACLLSFPTAEAKFGKDELEALEGQEESTSGQRVLFQPVLTGKLGPFIVRNTTDLGYDLFNGAGPYFYEAEYDTLLKDGDLLVNNQTACLLQAWKGQEGKMLMTGPFYEITHATEANINRQRIGLQLYWLPAATAWIFDQPRIYGRIGVNLQDRNRDDELFFGVGCGADF